MAAGGSVRLSCDGRRGIRGADALSDTNRSEVRSVILRLRRYRDRMEGVVAAAATTTAATGTAAVSRARQIKALKSDLDNDAHECVIGRKRMKQTECEQDFLWPALRDAAAALHERAGNASAEASFNAELTNARGCIQHYLTQLEDRWPTL